MEPRIALALRHQPDDGEAAVAAGAGGAVRTALHPGRGPVAGTGRGVRPRGGGQAGTRRGPDGHVVVPGRLLHDGGVPGRQPRGDRRGGDAGHGHLGPRLGRPRPGQPRSDSGPRPDHGRDRRTRAVRGGAGRTPGDRTPPPDVRVGSLRGLHPGPGPGDRGTLPVLAGGRGRGHVPHLVGRPGACGGGESGRVEPHPRLPTGRLDDPLPAGVLNGRGQLGDGAIDLRAWCELVEAAGYRGPIEVELFNEELWARDGVEVLEETVGRFVDHAGRLG